MTRLLRLLVCESKSKRNEGAELPPSFPLLQALEFVGPLIHRKPPFNLSLFEKDDLS
jgi:hypothetical protein